MLAFRLIAHNQYVKREIVRVQNPESGEWEEAWTGDYIFENEWQSFRTKEGRSLELKSIFHECAPGRRKLAVKVVDIFYNENAFYSVIKSVEFDGFNK